PNRWPRPEYRSTGSCRAVAMSASATRPATSTRRHASSPVLPAPPAAGSRLSTARRPSGPPPRSPARRWTPTARVTRSPPASRTGWRRVAHPRKPSRSARGAAPRASRAAARTRVSSATTADGGAPRPGYRRRAMRSSGEGAQSQALPHFRSAQRGKRLRRLAPRRDLSEQLLGDGRYLEGGILHSVRERRAGLRDPAHLADVLPGGSFDLFTCRGRLEPAQLGD